MKRPHPHTISVHVHVHVIVACKLTCAYTYIHVHITYMLTNKDQIASAGALRDVAEKEFAQLLGEDYKCAGTPSDSSGRYGEPLLASLYALMLSLHRQYLCVLLIG